MAITESRFRTGCRAYPYAEGASGGAVSCGPDIWLTPAQAVYFFVTGDNLVEVMHLPEDIVIGASARIPSAFVPLSADAGPEERAAAFARIKEQLAMAGESPYATAIKWRDRLLATGLVVAEGRRTPSGPYETIKPVEFCDLRLAGPHARKAKSEIVFYDIRLSGWGLSRARQQALASDGTAELGSKGRLLTETKGSVTAGLRAAIETVLTTLGTPGKQVPWQRFCDVVRSECGVAAATRGYGDRSIARAVKEVNCGNRALPECAPPSQDGRDKSEAEWCVRVERPSRECLSTFGHPPTASGLPE